MMNKLYALTKCREDWARYYFTGKAFSSDHDCHACKFDKQHDHNFCHAKCIISWPDIKHGCYGKDSPYPAWKNATTKEARKHHAKRMLTLIDKALIEIGG